jgi:hypothetical protein
MEALTIILCSKGPLTNISPFKLVPRIYERSSDVDALRPLRVQYRTFPTVPTLPFTHFCTLTNIL